MSKSTNDRTQKIKTPAALSGVQNSTTVFKFVTTTWEELESKYRDVARYVVGACGAFGGNDAEPLFRAIQRLADPQAERKRTAWYDKHFTGGPFHDVGDTLAFTGDREQAVQAIWAVSDADQAVENARVESAYLLGIAVGRLIVGGR